MALTSSPRLFGSGLCPLPLSSPQPLTARTMAAVTAIEAVVRFNRHPIIRVFLGAKGVVRRVRGHRQGLQRSSGLFSENRLFALLLESLGQSVRPGCRIRYIARARGDSFFDHEVIEGASSSALHTDLLTLCLQRLEGLPSAPHLTVSGGADGFPNPAASTRRLISRGRGVGSRWEPKRLRGGAGSRL